MPRDWRLYAQDIFDYVTLVQKTIAEYRNFEDFLADKKGQLAVERCFEILGEATKHIPLEIKERFPDIRWKAIVGMRDQIAHGYHKIDEEIIWNSAREQLFPLKAAIEVVLNEYKA